MSTLDALFTAALDAQRMAHAPYSHFRVGAAVLDEAGSIHSNCNVENASYPVGTCAEAGAIAQMVRSGGRRIKELLLVCDGKQLGTPCGACRQRIREFAEDSLVIHLADRTGPRVSITLGELLPMSFGPDHLL